MHKHICYLSLLLILSFCFIIQGVLAQQEPKPEVKPESDQTKKEDEKKKEEKKDELKPFDEVIKDFNKIEGLFTFYRKAEDGKVLMEIKPDQFDRIFLCSITRQAGDAYYFDSGSMGNYFPFIFKQVGKQLQFIHKNVHYRADQKAPINRAIAGKMSDSILGSAKVESQPHPERKSVLVDLSGILLQDLNLVSYLMSEFIKMDYAFDKDNSYFGAVKSFPENSEVEVVLHFKTAKPKFIPTLPDSRSMIHRYNYSFSTLPSTGYKPRLADDRIGHFWTMYQDYTSVERETPYVRYIERWHLEKADPKAELSPPKQPIVFWLENTIPLEYREAIKEGVLMWNQAFEKVGFKDAIVVKHQPDDADWDPADVRYNTIRWVVTPGAGYAVGPSRANPFTGQIYDADIRISSDFARYYFLEFEEFIDPVASSQLPEFQIFNSDHVETTRRVVSTFFQNRCTYGEGLARQIAFGLNLLAVRGDGIVDPSHPEVKKFIQDGLRELTAHEVGHTLGLRHNFKASSLHPNAQLHNEKLTLEMGITSSVMDYNVANIAPEGVKQGQYWQSTLGPYDYWTIEYAYKPITADTPENELAELNKIASKVADPLLPYGTDEDLWGWASTDPTCNAWDLGSDPIQFCIDRISLAEELWNKIETKFERPGLRYQKLRQVFWNGLGEFRRSTWIISKYIGGLYQRRDHIGDPGNRIPFEPVPAKKQREALEFLKANIFSADAFNFSPTLLNKLAPERFWDFEGSVFRMPRLDFPIHNVILSIQSAPLSRLYHPIVLSRMLDLELKYRPDEKPFTMAEMFEGVRGSIWSELDSKKEVKVNSFRRALQREHLSKLIELTIRPAAGIPEDARSLARADLILLKAKIEKATKKKQLDSYSRAHFDETLARLDAALKAQVELQKL